MRARLALTLALLVGAAVTMIPAPAPAVECIGQLYKWCGDRWQSTDLPLTVVGPSSGEDGISVSQARDAVRVAALTWEAVWPGTPKLCPSGSAWPTAKLFCYVPGGSNAVGVVEVRFASSAHYCSSGSGWIATRCAQKSGSFFWDADITLNTAKDWRVASAAELGAGEGKALAGSTGQGVLPVTWYDVQAVVTHELGHVFGLEDLYSLASVNDCATVGGFPGDLTAAANYRQTMYGCHWTGTANKRTLEEGDVAGALRVAQATY